MKCCAPRAGISWRAILISCFVRVFTYELNEIVVLAEHSIHVISVLSQREFPEHLRQYSGRELSGAASVFNGGKQVKFLVHGFRVWVRLLGVLISGSWINHMSGRRQGFGDHHHVGDHTHTDVIL